MTRTHDEDLLCAGAEAFCSAELLAGVPVAPPSTLVDTCVGRRERWRAGVQVNNSQQSSGTCLEIELTAHEPREPTIPA